MVSLNLLECRYIQKFLRDLPKIIFYAYIENGLVFSVFSLSISHHAERGFKLSLPILESSDINFQPVFNVNSPHIIRGLILKKKGEDFLVLEKLEETRRDEIAKGFHQTIMGLGWDITPEDAVTFEERPDGLVLQVIYWKYIPGLESLEENSFLPLKHQSQEAKIVIEKILAPLLSRVLEGEISFGIVD